MKSEKTHHSKSTVNSSQIGQPSYVVLCLSTPLLLLIFFLSLSLSLSPICNNFHRIPMRKPCCDKKDTNKGAWSKQEDQKLIEYIQKHGEGRWRLLPEAAGLLRCGKSCRLRWINYLRPDLKRGNFAEDEDDLIIKLHALLGNRWSLIAGRLPGRTDNEVKNYWNTHLRKKLIAMGIDPNNNRLRYSVPHPQLKNSQDANDHFSDASTSLENKACGLPDLNLNLAESNIMEE